MFKATMNSDVKPADQEDLFGTQYFNNLLGVSPDASPVVEQKEMIEIDQEIKVDDVLESDDLSTSDDE